MLVLFGVAFVVGLVCQLAGHGRPFTFRTVAWQLAFGLSVGALSRRATEWLIKRRSR